MRILSHSHDTLIVGRSLKIGWLIGWMRKHGGQNHQTYPCRSLCGLLARLIVIQSHQVGMQIQDGNDLGYAL